MWARRMGRNELQHFEVSPIQGSHIFAMFCAHALHDERVMPVMHTHILPRQPLPDFINIGVLAACLHCMALHPTQLWWFLDNFFLLSVRSLKKNCLGELGALEHNFYTGTQNRSKLDISHHGIKFTAL